ncbi:MULTISPECIES: hypothetical protein [Polaromonas]|uniref:DUF11 domain-containing protein n=1 Tax=Polaromonas aquatica TaxID=332657 RepID=A0ABW1TWP3_9BURK
MRAREYLGRLSKAVLALTVCLTSTWIAAQVCSTPQKDGAKTSSAGEVVNGYYTPANGNFSSGSLPTIALSNPRGTVTSFAPGDMALLIQMQCVDLNMTDTDSYGDGVAGFPASGYIATSGTCRAGQYEYVPAGAGTTPSSFVAGAPLQNTYVQSDPTASSTRRSFQIIRVPQYSTLTLGGQLNALPWDGRNGGVLAVDTAKNTNFAGQTLFAGAQGFRGGGGRPSTVNGNNPFRYNDGPGVAHATKAEGLAGTPPLLFTDGSPFDRNDSAGTVTLNVGAFYGYPGNTGTVADYNYAKGAPANAGGGGTYRDGAYHNGGGGGGGNGGAGGRGGFGWRSAGWAGVASDYSNIVAVTGDNLAAFGGSSFGGAGISRVSMGGGGGAGDQNGNSNNTREMAGGTGGGIVIIRSGSLSGAATIDVRGGVANSNPLNDAAGAGAGGGSVILVSPNWTTGVITINAGGGQGGDAWLSGNGGAHSGGGGGGGGVVVRTGPATIDVSGGTNGITNTSDNPPGGSSHGALPGNTGVDVLLAESSDPMSNSGYRCLPQTDLSISKTANPVSLSIGQTTTFTLVVGNTGLAQATSASVIDALPTGLGTLTFVSASGSNAATTLTSSSITGQSTFTGTVTIPANQTLTILLKATAGANGALINSSTVSPPAASNDANLSNNASTATVVVGPSADLAATKSASTPSLALNQTTTFTLVYTNSGPSAVTGATLID